MEPFDVDAFAKSLQSKNRNTKKSNGLIGVSMTDAVNAVLYTQRTVENMVKSNTMVTSHLFDYNIFVSVLVGFVELMQGKPVGGNQIVDQSSLLVQIKDRKDLFVVGDIHGDINSLFTIFKMSTYPSKDVTFVFLGDYVDRGAYSIEVLTVLMSYKILYPNNVFLLRGNHDTPEKGVWRNYGFQVEMLNFLVDNGKLKLKKPSKRKPTVRELQELVPEKPYQDFEQMVSVACAYFPIFLIHNNLDAFVHGCIPNFELGKINYLQILHRLRLGTIQFSTVEQEVVDQCLWNDPLTEERESKLSERGVNIYLVGGRRLAEFLYGARTLVRAHQIVPKGWKMHDMTKHAKELQRVYKLSETPPMFVITVFSSMNYRGMDGEASFLYFGPHGATGINFNNKPVIK